MRGFRWLREAGRQAPGRHVSAAPIVIGALASWAAVSPSLIPRRWWMTGVSVAGAASATALGTRLALRGQRPWRCALGRLSPRLGDVAGRRGVRLPADAPHPWLRGGVLVLTAVGTGAALARASVRQQELSRLLRMRPEGEMQLLLGFAAGWLGWGGLEAAVRGVRRMRLRTARLLAARLPWIPSAVVTAAVMLWTLTMDRWLLGHALTRADHWAVMDSFARLGARPRPVEPERSGSPQSPEPFATMGMHGRRFVTEGPRAARTAEAWARPALTSAAASPEGGDAAREPIRVFIGRLGHPDPAEAAQATVAELERTGAFERRAILLAAGTGSGWVPPWQVEAFEYLMRGDCATASAQYSFADSWLAFLIHREPAKALSLALRRAVRSRLDAMPAASRPRLYATGESLGAYGGLGAYGSPGAMLRRLDGAVWTGTPRASRILTRLLAARAQGSPEAHPVHGAGRHFRFVARPRDLWEAPEGCSYGRWARPRIVFAQHPSDPVVWWSPELIWRRPDWLREPRGEGVSSAVRWRPLVTFAQLTADMPRSVGVSGGYGHSYHGEVVHYWNAVLGTGHPPEVCDEIAAVIAEDLAPASGTLPLSDVSVRMQG
ncbi:alpha/beta-hydrolase family protein [Brevibacterium album]|uniref:alpha/beta-hydrolase family protein n=1 Tax=Brevibacterium album TaxID=417948 RepID=UPI001FE0CCE5|nr:alpha/beta-hydrolase family protein [Brevibacterium album]